MTNSITTNQTDYYLEGLYYLAKYFNKEISKEQLILEQSNNKMHIKEFLATSKKIGLTGKVAQRDLDGISKLAMPVILILQDNKICILFERDEPNKTFSILVPGTNNKLEKIHKDQLTKSFKGEIIIIKPEYRFKDKITTQLDIGEDKNWFWDAIKRNSILYQKAILAAIFINLFVLAIPLFMKNVFDRVLPNNAMETLLAMSIGIFIILIFEIVFSLLRAYYLGKAAKTADLIMSNRIFSHLLNIRLDEKPPSTGQFVSKLQSFNSVREFLTSATIATLVDIPFALFFLAIIFYFAGNLGWVSVVTVILVITISFIMQKKIKSVVEKSAKEEQTKQTTLNETVAGLEIIKCVRGQNKMRTQWDNALNETLYYGDKSHFLSEITKKTTDMIIKLSSIVVIIIGVYLSLAGDLTMGGIIVAMMLNSRVIAPINQIVGMIIKYDQMLVSYKNIEQIMQMGIERENKQYISKPNLLGDIEFNNVSFSYKGMNTNTLKKLNFTIAHGEKVAIVGKIGSGKSTIAKLLMNLYTPKEGTIKIDNTDIKNIDPLDLRKSIGCVPQEPFLFIGSVKDNIVIGEQFATDNEILEASKISGVHDFIGKHEAGYDLLVGERGEGLSGGERQTITLARALLNKPNIIVLDEPTASMDRQTEHMFIKNMKKILTNETLILITHKASTLTFVDRVIEIDNGEIVSNSSTQEFFNKKKAA